MTQTPITDRPFAADPAWTLALLALALVLCISSVARADVVGPPPDSCPPGSEPSSSHSGPLCYPTADCTTDSSCSGSAACMAVMQCIETRGCGGLMPPDSAPCTVEHVVGACDGAGACSVGACRARRVCIPGAVGRGGGCACHVGRGAPSASAFAFIAGVLALVACRRRGHSVT